MLRFLILARFTLDIKLLASGRIEWGQVWEGREPQRNYRTETLSKRIEINLFCSRAFFLS